MHQPFKIFTEGIIDGEVMSVFIMDAGLPWSETAGYADENVEDPGFGLGCLNYLSV